MSVQDIQAAIAELPAGEIESLLAWIEEYRADAWDRQIERDAAAGRLDAFAAEALAEYHAGLATEV